MKAKKHIPAKILLAVTIIIYLAATIFLCYTTKPAVTTGEFPFSITYECKDETKVLSGVFKCKYSGSYTLYGKHERHWDQDTVYDNPENVESPFVIDQNDKLQTTLSIYENMDAGYFMGDPKSKDHYKDEGLDGVEPRVAYYDYKNDIFLDDATEADIPEYLEFKIIDFTYAEPIENSFSFSGIRYEADNMIIFIVISLAFLIACLVSVRKEKEYQYSRLDKAGIAFNFIVGFAAVPFISLFCFMFGIVEFDSELINQIIYNIPSIAILSLALSVVFRRKGHPKTSFFIQFAGILLFIFTLLFTGEL